MAAETITAESGEPAIPEQVQIRAEKRRRILASGREPYPVAVPVTAEISDLRAEYGDLPAGEVTEIVVGVSGRVVFLRNTGRLCFVTLQDGSGNRIQAMLSEKAIGKQELASFKTDVDLGDILFVAGPIGTSKRGELSVFANQWQIATKALRPLPVLHKDMTEESRVRQRYVDLIIRPEARDMVRTRAAVMRSLRDNLHERSFLEIETPMLQTIASGAAARPFQTHMNAYDIDLFLRIAPELFLKRAVVGGIERVFEINRNFRNEGADSSHSPEFAMLEVYEAYGDYNSMAELTQSLVQRAAVDALGTTVVQLPEGTVDASGARQTEYDLGGEWTTISMYESLSAALGRQITPDTDATELLSEAIRFGLHDPEKASALGPPSHGKLVETLWEHQVGEHLWEPTFVRDFPVETSPLTRSHRNTVGVVEKWDLYIRGFELATAYSELVDPVIQRERLVAQAELAAAGDGDAMEYDEDFLVAMEHGMPPSGGMGMGIDRLLMALTGQGIRETILFPLVKPTGR